eukprot:3702070-Pleurochrysis_carterae.AAC.1
MLTFARYNQLGALDSIHESDPRSAEVSLDQPRSQQRLEQARRDEVRSVGDFSAPQVPQDYDCIGKPCIVKPPEIWKECDAMHS